MSPQTSITNKSNNSNSASSMSTPNEWVEIIEPKSKQRIYANLETGVCAKHPPDGAIISRSEDFSDHWWELYDQKTGKYYYYNPEQQKTAWTRPVDEEESSSTVNGKINGGDKKKLLIIPVSKLQTFKKLSAASEQQIVEKRDASTQTIASNLVSIGIQTIRESSLENEFKNKLGFIDVTNDSSKSSSCTHSSSSNSTKSHLDHRQLSDLYARRDRKVNLQETNQADNNKQFRLRNPISLTSVTTAAQAEQNKSSHLDSVNGIGEHYLSYLGQAPASYHKERSPISIQSPKYHRTDEYMSSTSTFGDMATRPPHSGSGAAHKLQQHHKEPREPQKISTNNLSHYLVREARAMGIALISDDELDDEDQDSDEDCVLDDDDEDTDLHDDASSHRGVASDLNASQDLGEDSSEGWKSFSDQESPNDKISLQNKDQKSHQSVQKSPIHCEIASSFTYNDLIDDQKDPAASLSQQLDHRKLVENFKKSRQTSSFGLHDSLGRSYKLDHAANHAVQRIKTVADNYFNHDREQTSDRHLRQLSTLSTLPRPSKETKDRVALSKQQEDSCGNIIDADYDVVEDNCGYYSDSEQPNQSVSNATDASNKVSSSSFVVNNKTILKTGELQHAPNSHFDRSKSSRGSTFSVESFARENLTRHPKKGGLIFNRKVKWSRMLSWTKSSIKQPMVSSVSSDLNADSITSFKLIQQFMGDRKVTITKKYRQILAQSSISEDQKDHNQQHQQQQQNTKKRNLGRSGSMNAGQNNSSSINSNSHVNLASIPDKLRDELAYELVVKGCSKSALRDEIYVQLARQLTENPNQDSIQWGLILMSILVSYFSPSNKFSPFLLSFLDAHQHQMALDVCLPRLEKRLRQNWLTYCRKPADGKEISIVRLSITKWPQYCGVFGESLERIMSLQTCSPYLKTLRLPWILTTLGDKLIETGGAETEGIFRCAADHDLISQLRLEIDCVDFRKIMNAKQVHSLLSNVQDPHVIAGLLKLFFRQLYEPVFPASLYDTCLQSGQDGYSAVKVFNERLSNLNKDVVAYLIRLLQMLAKSDKVVHTKMDNSNLSMVWAPNLLRAIDQQQEKLLAQCESKSGSKWSIANGSIDEQQQQQPIVVPSQSMIFEQTRQEMQFIRSLIIHLDTSFIENVI